MTDVKNINLQEAVKIRNEMSDYRDILYLGMIRQIKEKTDDILKDDLGNQFIYSCGRDLAGEVVRTYFDTSDYNITVDQLARRIREFNYTNEYDPLSNSGELQKMVYNYNDISSSTLDEISSDLDKSQEKLFKKVNGKYEDRDLMEKGKNEYAISKTNEDKTITDEYTGQIGGRKRTLGDHPTNRQEVDHTQSANSATFPRKYMTEPGVNELKHKMNSADNFAMMEKSANASKGDVQVYEKNGKILSQSEIKEQKAQIKQRLGKNATQKEVAEEFEKEAKNITSRATPKQLANAVCDRWENAGNKQALIDKGYLNEDGKVPKSVREKLEDNVKYSQNQESKTILKNTQYGKVAKEAAGHNAKNIGKIIAGQVIYYAVPPIVYEARCIVQNKKNITIDNAMNKLSSAGKRIGNYVYSHLKDIFKNIASNSLKKFIKSFMDILIGMVKTTVKKILKVVKSLVMAVVDSVRIIATPGTSAAQKADAVFNLFGITVTNVVIELLFEAIENGAHIPEYLLKPLQIVTSVICTNFTMLILQKADVFDVRLGFKIEAIKKVFTEEKEIYQREMRDAEQFADSQVNEIIEYVKKECIDIYYDLLSMDTKKQSVRGDLEKVSQMFHMDINFEDAWLHYLGLPVG